MNGLSQEREFLIVETAVSIYVRNRVWDCSPWTFLLNPNINTNRNSTGLTLTLTLLLTPTLTQPCREEKSM